MRMTCLNAGTEDPGTMKINCRKKMKNMKCDVMKKICAVVALGLLLDGAVGVTQAKGQMNPQNEKGMENWN